METVITHPNFNSGTKTCKEENQLEPYSSLPKEEHAFKKFEKEDDIKIRTNVNNEESYKLFIDELFKIRGFITNETWEKTINVDSKIISKDKNSVVCECLIDRTNNLFEKMIFPSHIFSHIENYKVNPYVILSIKSKTGSTRIDVIKGEGLVDKKAFELNEEWEKLDGKDFNQPLNQPLAL